MKVFLDDIRMPPDKSWVVVRSYDEFVNLVKSTPHIITEISFDHDLGVEEDGKTPTKSGMDAAKFLVDYIIDEKPIIGKLLEKIIVHSANPAGKANILGYFSSAKKSGDILNPDLEIIK